MLRLRWSILAKPNSLEIKKLILDSESAFFM